MTTVNKVITLFGDDEEEGNNPFIVSFDSVPQAELLESTGSKRSSGARITCYERPHKRTKKGAAKGSGSASDLSDDDDEDKEAESASSSEDEDDENIDVVAETEKVMFHGTTNGRTTLPMRHAIAIKDNKSGNITFVEVPPVVALHKFMKLGLEDMEEDITREAGTAIAMSDYMKYKNNLTEVFGNHKKKLQIRAATANALPDKIADITEDEIKQTQAVIEEKLKEAADEASTRDLPHCNPKALTAEEAYPLSGMFFSEVLDIVFEKADGLMKFVREGPMSFMHEFAEVCPQVSIYATEIIKNISNVPQEKLRNVITSLVLYNYIVTFYQLPLKSIRTKSKIMTAAEEVKIPGDVVLGFTARFLEKDVQPGRPVFYQRTKLSVLKMRNFMAVLALRIEDFALNPKSMSFIARDFGLQIPAVVLNFERIGSARRKIPGKETNTENFRWTLPIPVKPKIRATRGQKAKKKTF